MGGLKFERFLLSCCDCDDDDERTPFVQFSLFHSLSRFWRKIENLVPVLFFVAKSLVVAQENLFFAQKKLLLTNFWSEAAVAVFFNFQAGTRCQHGFCPQHLSCSLPLSLSLSPSPSHTHTHERRHTRTHTITHTYLVGTKSIHFSTLARHLVMKTATKLITLQMSKEVGAAWGEAGQLLQLETLPARFWNHNSLESFLFP